LPTDKEISRARGFEGKGKFGVGDIEYWQFRAVPNGREAGGSHGWKEGPGPKNDKSSQGKEEKKSRVGRETKKDPE